MPFTKNTEVTTPAWTRSSGNFRILQEDGFDILLETGEYLLNETSQAANPWTLIAEVTTPAWAGAGGWFWENVDIKWEDMNIKWEDAGG